MSDQEKLQRIESLLIEMDEFLNSRTQFYAIASLLFSYFAVLSGFIFFMLLI